MCVMCVVEVVDVVDHSWSYHNNNSNNNNNNNDNNNDNIAILAIMVSVSEVVLRWQEMYYKVELMLVRERIATVAEYYGDFKIPGFDRRSCRRRLHYLL